MSRVKENEKGVGVSRQRKDKQTLSGEGGEGDAHTHLFEDVYLIFYGPAVVPNIRSLMHSGQQMCSRESGKAATDDGNFDASRVWIRIREITHLRKVAESFTLCPSLALNGGKGNLEGHGDTEAPLHRKA
jgi:hypothetical protein